MAQEPPATAEEIQKRIDMLKKQKELLDLEKQVADAQKALVTNPPLDVIVEAKAAKEVADARKALADANKALSDSQLAAFKSSLGDVPSSGLTGAVEVKEKTGELEAALLAMAAVGEAAGQIGNRVQSALPQKGRIVALSAGDVPTFDNMIAYDAEKEIVRAVLANAVKAATPPEAAPVPEAVPLMGAAGLILDATNKLLSFFKTDFTVQGIALTVEDTVALASVASELSKKGFVVFTPAIYDPQAINEAAQFFINDIKTLSDLRQKAEAQLKRIEALIADLNVQIKAAAEGPTKKALEAQLPVQTTLVNGLKAAIALMDAWYTKLGAPDSRGVALLVRVTKEKAIATRLKDANLLVVKVQKAGGGFLTKKNLWTLFGGMPLYHMGGAAVSFTLLSGDDGSVKAAGVVPVHGGFVKAGDLEQRLAR